MMGLCGEGQSRATLAGPAARAVGERPRREREWEVGSSRKATVRAQHGELDLTDVIGVAALCHFVGSITRNSATTAIAATRGHSDILTMRWGASMSGWKLH